MGLVYVCVCINTVSCVVWCLGLLCVCVYQQGTLSGLGFGVWGWGFTESVALEWFGFGVYGFRVYLKPERAVHLSGRL